MEALGQLAIPSDIQIIHSNEYSEYSKDKGKKPDGANDQFQSFDRDNPDSVYGLIDTGAMVTCTTTWTSYTVTNLLIISVLCLSNLSQLPNTGLCLKDKASSMFPAKMTWGTYQFESIIHPY